MNDRVRYCGVEDMNYCPNIGKIEVIKIPEFSDISINDAIEFYNIDICFKKCKKLDKWSNNKYEEYKNKSKELSSIFYKFFNEIDGCEIVEQYPTIETLYCECFWEIFDNLRIYRKLDSTLFRKLIHQKHIPPYTIFSYKKIVEKYGNVLKDYILEYESCIRLVLEWFYEDKQKIFLPKEFTSEDLNIYLDKYISGDHVHPFNLKRIKNIKDKRPLQVDDIIRIKAKRRYEQEANQMFDSKKNVKIEYGVNIEFTPNIDELVLYKNNSNIITISYNSNWLLENTQTKDILANFIYLFDYVDKPQMRSNHINKLSKLSLFENMLLDQSSMVYPTGEAFNFIQMISLGQIQNYYYLLNSTDIRLEDFIENYFINYIHEEFECPRIKIKLPSKYTSFSEKCSIALTTFESILKQYNAFVENGDIDYELISISSKPISIGTIKSLVTGKYIYSNSKILNNINSSLFSSQSNLLSINKVDNKDYSSFIELIYEEEIYLDDFVEYQKDGLNILVKNKIINILSDNRLVIDNLDKITIFRDIYENYVISKHHYNEKSVKIIDELVKNKLFKEESTLFSKTEADYLDYILNNKKYVNGLQLRNKYLHGTQQSIEDESYHEKNYFIILNIIILLILKINDDLCLKYSEY